MKIHERTNLMMQENMRIMSREISELRRQRTPSPFHHTAMDQSSSSEEERPRERRPLKRPQNLEQLTFGSLGSREDVARVLGPNDPSLREPMLLPMRGSHVLPRDPNLTNPTQGQMLQPLPPEIDRERREQSRVEAARRRGCPRIRSPEETQTSEPGSLNGP